MHVVLTVHPVSTDSVWPAFPCLQNQKEIVSRCFSNTPTYTCAPTHNEQCPPALPLTPVHSLMLVTSGLVQTASVLSLMAGDLCVWNVGMGCVWDSDMCSDSRNRKEVKCGACLWVLFFFFWWKLTCEWRKYHSQPPHTRNTHTLI